MYTTIHSQQLQSRRKTTEFLEENTIAIKKSLLIFVSSWGIKPELTNEKGKWFMKTLKTHDAEHPTHGDRQVREIKKYNTMLLEAIKLGQQLTKKEMKSVTGGYMAGAGGTCCSHPNGGMDGWNCGISKAQAKAEALDWAMSGTPASWCCASC